MTHKNKFKLHLGYPSSFEIAFTTNIYSQSFQLILKQIYHNTLSIDSNFLYLEHIRYKSRKRKLIIENPTKVHNNHLRDHVLDGHKTVILTPLEKEVETKQPPSTSKEGGSLSKGKKRNVSHDLISNLLDSFQSNSRLKTT